MMSGRLQDLGAHCFAWLQPNGSWGLSNAGLVVDSGEALLVDTLIDLTRTGAMLAAMRDAEPAARKIGTLVNTHANPDHTSGNSLLEGASIIASAAAARAMPYETAAVLAAAVRDARAANDQAGRYLLRCFDSFDLEGITPKFPDRVFSGELSLRVGERRVDLYEVASAHTSGDVLVHVPSTGVVFTGDLLFLESHPIMWTGPIENWIAACDRIVELNPAIVVPGHGPITDLRGVRVVRDYLVFVRERARVAFDAGLSAFDAATSIGAQFGSSTWANWVDRERIVATVHALYRGWTKDSSPPNVPALCAEMARFDT